MLGLSKVLEQKLNDTAIIDRLVKDLENQNIPDYFRLSSFSHSLRRQIYSYIRTDVIITNYYKTVLDILNAFTELINDFQEKVQKNLLSKLKRLQTNVAGNNKQWSSSEETEVAIIVIGKFLDELYDHYEDFSHIINSESRDFKSVTVTTHMQQYLLKLVSFIEKLIQDLTSTQKLRTSWGQRIIKRELQEVYN
jgi:hypothetical protein